MKFLLDTNVLSEAAKSSADSQVLNKIEKHQSDIVTAAPVWHEMQYGCFRLPVSKKRTIIDKFLNEVVLPNIPILPYDKPAANWHAIQRARLVAMGKTPSFVDGQIAAIATVNNFCLITRNISDFTSFQGLKVKNWHKA